VDQDHEQPGGDDLRVEEIVATGGAWHGVLFDNPSIGLAPSLTWSLTVDCQAVVRDVDSSPVSVTVEWLPMPVPSWTRMAPGHAQGQHFGELAECSIYFQEHHCFGAFDLALYEQRGAELRAALTVREDLDGLGLDPVSVEAWLRFEGLIVHLSDVTSPSQALQRLADFIDVTGLIRDDGWTGSGFCFYPSTSQQPD
jgi:hypothetical protein